jgi:hypothetical protein
MTHNVNYHIRRGTRDREVRIKKNKFPDILIHIIVFALSLFLYSTLEEVTTA